MRLHNNRLTTIVGGDIIVSLVTRHQEAISRMLSKAWLVPNAAMQYYVVYCAVRGEGKGELDYIGERDFRYFFDLDENQYKSIKASMHMFFDENAFKISRADVNIVEFNDLLKTISDDYRYLEPNPMIRPGKYSSFVSSAYMVSEPRLAGCFMDVADIESCPYK